jgi:translation initiation factor IF-2
MSEGNIRINKVLRELNISLERAVDYLKGKGIVIENNSNTKISDDVYNILCAQFAGDKGNKEASIGVSEEIRKEKEALRLEREKELEDKRRLEEERQKSELIKAKAIVTAPKQVGKIDLELKAKVAITPSKETAKIAISPEKSEVVRKNETSPIKDSKEKVAKVNEDKQSVAKPSEEDLVDETITTQYQKLSGATLTGQVIDLTQFNKPKKKKEDFKKDANKPTTPIAGQTTAQATQNAANKNKRKRIPPKPGDKPAITSGGNTQGGTSKFVPKQGFQKGNRPAIVQKVEPTEEEVKNQIKETLERLQGKGNKSKAAKYRRDKRDTHRQRNEDEMQAIEEGSKTIKVTEFVTVGEIATMMDVPITKVIGTCMSLGIMVTMNQRLDAETLSIVADEFGYEVEFITSRC